METEKLAGGMHCIAVEEMGRSSMQLFDLGQDKPHQMDEMSARIKKSP